MDLQLSNKTALITSASKGLGIAIAKRLVMEGVKAIICSRNKDHLENAVNEIKKETNKCVDYYIADMTDSEATLNLHNQLVSNNHQPDILIYNVGGPAAGNFPGPDENEWEQSYISMIKNYRLLLQLIIPKMKEQKWGRILAVASVSVRQPLESLIISNTFRPAIAGLNKTLSDQYAPHGITFNTLCPGAVDTLRVKDVLQKRALLTNTDFSEVENQYLRQIPMKRFGRPEEVGDAAAFIVSQNASFITGICLAVDGGITRSIF